MQAQVKRVLFIAAAVRLLPLFFGNEHYGDASVRIEIAQRRATYAAVEPREFRFTMHEMQ